MDWMSIGPTVGPSLKDFVSYVSLVRTRPSIVICFSSVLCLRRVEPLLFNLGNAWRTICMHTWYRCRWAIKLPLLNFSNFSIAKLVVNKIVRVKITLSRLTTNTELISNIWFLKMQLKLATIKIEGFDMQRKWHERL